MFRKVVCIVLTSCILFSCQEKPVDSTKLTVTKTETTSVSEVSKMPKKSLPVEAKMKQLSFIATVRYMNLEGGFFGLISKEGKHWLPMNLSQEFQQNGAIIKVKGNAIEGMLTMQQWGTPFSITHIELIKAGKKVSNNNLL